MGLRTWQIKIGDRLINVKGKKDDVEKLERDIERFLCIEPWTKNLCGIRDKEEYTTLSCLLSFGAKEDYGPLPHPEEYALDKLVYVAELPDTITDVDAERAKVEALFNKHVRVKDERQTEIEREAQQQNYLKMHNEQEEQRLAETHKWLDARGISHEPVTIPDGMMAITAQFTYDGSDPMSDYSHPHAHVGQTMVLALVPRQAETERLARSAVARYPDLLEHKFEWFTEKYSMGHGNYLQSEYFDTAQIWNGEVKTRLEIEFTTGRHSTLYQYPGYPGTGPAYEAPVTCNGDKPVMQLNAARNGVEVKFPAKPDNSAISLLKSSGFRWSSRQQLWYAKQSPATIKAAEQLINS